MASIKLPIILISLVFHLVCGNVPVLLWESSKSDNVDNLPALHRMASEDFQRYLLKKVHGEQPVPLIVVFAEESLSIEDFSLKDSQGQGSFPQLKYITENSANSEFQTSVQNPIAAIKQLSEFGFSIQNLDNKEVSDLSDGCGKILILRLPEANSYEDRPEFLRRHDILINEVYSQLLSKCSHVIGILTGEQSSWLEPEEVSRLRRSPEDENVANIPNNASPTGEKYTLFRDNKEKPTSILFSTNKLQLVIDGKEVEIPEINPTMTGDNSKASEIKLMVKYGSEHRLTFIFDNSTWAGYWQLRSVVYESKPGASESSSIILKSSQDIIAPVTNSYHIGSKVSFYNRTMNASLGFDNMQVQPFFVNLGSKKFAAAIDAVEFFTPAIWSGLFVTFLLGLIFTWGLSMIMDIRTMDQFDDPKGKTITVTATD